MSKEIRKETSKQLANCPFCNEELERHCTSRYYMHKLNGCILQHFCFEADDVEGIEKWNTRKPMDRIVERLKEERLRANENLCPKNSAVACSSKSCEACYMDEAIKIVKEEGGE